MTVYLLDTNVFIEAERDYYNNAIAPTYWDWLIKQHQDKNIASTHDVYNEITAGNPGFLRTWAIEKAPSSFWIKSSNSDAPAFQALTDWVYNKKQPPFRPEAIDEFLRIADYSLIAQAKSLGCAVATREQSAPAAVKRVHIPDACMAIGVKHYSPFQIYKKLGLRF